MGGFSLGIPLTRDVTRRVTLAYARWSPLSECRLHASITLGVYLGVIHQVTAVVLLANNK